MPGRHPITRAISAGVIEVKGIMTDIALVALARRDRTDLPRFAVHGPDGEKYDGYEAVLMPFRDAIAMAFDDVGAAFDSARSALRTSYERHGLAAYFTLIWPVAVDWGVESGQLDEARDLLALVTRAGPGQATSVLRAPSGCRRSSTPPIPRPTLPKSRMRWSRRSAPSLLWGSNPTRPAAMLCWRDG